MVDCMIFPYKDIDSRIHRLDARPKLVFVVSVFVFSIVFSDILYLFAVLMFTLLVAYTARILRSALSILKYGIYVAIFVMIFNIVISSGSKVLISVGPVTITFESTLFATSMCLRLFLAMTAFSILAYAVHPDELLRVLSRLGHKTTTSLALSLRTYPTIAADASNIIDSMKSRGVEFEKGSFIEKIKSRTAVVMPLIMNSLERSISISEAMEARGFGTTKRTYYGRKSTTKIEKLMIISFSISVVLGLILFMLGYGNTDYLAGSIGDYSYHNIIGVLVLFVFLSPIFLGKKGG